MATHSSFLAWRIPGMGEPDGLPSMGSHRVRHDWSDLAAAAAAVGNPVVMYWCEIWTIKKVECRIIDAFELWCWRRLLRVPWTERKSKKRGAICTHSLYCTAAAAKSLQSCPTLYDPRDGSPPGSPVPGILQARTLEWVAISFSNAPKWKVKVKSLSRVRLFASPWILTLST